jgi:hypothetical protein
MSCNTNPSDINQTFIIEPLSITGGAPTISACTALYTNLVVGCSGDTTISLSSGYTQFNNNILVNNSISGSTIFSGGTNLYDIIISAITENDVYLTGATFSGGTLVLSRNDNQNILATFTGNTSGECISDLYVTNIYGCSPITLHNDLEPFIDSGIGLGSIIKRFREVNTLSGTSTLWTASTSITTAALELGLDSSGNTRTITANNSIIQNDILRGGSY